MTTTALVLETNNLRGAGGRARDSLARLLERLGEQTRPLASLDELVVTHDGLDDDARAALERAAKRSIAFVEIPPTCGYYDAKNAGFDATTAEVVAFGDGDCWPDPGWLAELLAPFHDPETKVVAGRTTYRDDLLGEAATAIDFIYYPGDLERGCVRNFYANNVAFRRDVFARFRYQPAPGIYRGHCQVLGLRLQEARVPVRFAGDARTVHRFPDRARDLLRLRLLRGSDTTELTPLLCRTYLPHPLDRAGRSRAAPLAVLAMRFGASLRWLRRETPRANRVRRIARASVTAALSLADGAGALAHALGAEVAGENASASALTYHSDRDGLSRRT